MNIVNITILQYIKFDKDMTIVSGPEQRNSEWANDTSTFGQKMLLKMGWSQGKGLGKNQQGLSTNLRAIRREEGLGIGASTDNTGDAGFSITSRNFHGVLASLQQHHGSGSSASITKEDSSTSQRKKKTKKFKKSERGLTMPSNRVTAGHARKMREAKDLNSKSKEDIAAIFGLKIEQYQQNSVWGRLSSLGESTANSSPPSSSSSAAGQDEAKSKDNKKKKKSKMNDQDKKKRKRSTKSSEDDTNIAQVQMERTKKLKKSKIKEEKI